MVGSPDGSMRRESLEKLRSSQFLAKIKKFSISRDFLETWRLEVFGGLLGVLGPPAGLTPSPPPSFYFSFIFFFLFSSYFSFYFLILSYYIIII